MKRTKQYYSAIGKIGGKAKVKKGFAVTGGSEAGKRSGEVRRCSHLFEEEFTKGGKWYARCTACRKVRKA